MSKEVFFVGIKNHLEVRRELLTSSKGMLDMLKRYENYLMIKADKLENVVDLKRIFDELLVLNKKLKDKLPKIPGRAPAIKLHTADPIQRPQGLKRHILEHKEIPKTKLEILEAELARVEKRLGSLE